MQVNRAVGEATLLLENEFKADAAGEATGAASHKYRDNEQLANVDQAGLERLSSEVGTANGQVACRRGFQPPDRLGIETSFDTGSRCCGARQRVGVDDLISGAPYGREFRYERWLVVRLKGVPSGHDFIHAATIEIRTDRAFEEVDEGVQLFVWLGPVEDAVLVGYVAVERHDDRIDQFRHGEPCCGRSKPPDN